MLKFQSFERKKGKTVSYSVSDNISGTNSPEFCEISIYRKIKRYNEITYCYKNDKYNNFSKKTRSLVFIDVDFKTLENIDKNEKVNLKKEKDVQLLSSCVRNVEKYEFIRENNIFTDAINLLYNGTLSYVPVFTSEMILKNNAKSANPREITNMSSVNTNNESIILKLTNEKRNIILFKNNTKLF